MMRMGNANMVIGILLAAVFCCSAHAELLVNEPFNYDEGPLVGSEGGLGFDGSWQHSGSYTGSDVQAGDDSWGAVTAPDGAFGAGASYARFWGSGGTGAIVRNMDFGIDFAPAAETTYYFSMLYRRVDGHNGGGTETLRFFDFRDDASPGTPLMIIGGTSGEAGLALLGGYGNQSTTAGAVYQISPDDQTIYNNMIIAKLIVRDAGNDELSVNFYETGTDTVSDTEPGTWDLTYENDVSGTSSSLMLSLQKYGGAAHVDGIRIATEYSEVIPEPATIALLACGLAAFRRKKA